LHSQIQLKFFTYCAVSSVEDSPRTMSHTNSSNEMASKPAVVMSDSAVDGVQKTGSLASVSVGNLAAEASSLSTKRYSSLGNLQDSLAFSS
jgi:hypothetical protein